MRFVCTAVNAITERDLCRMVTGESRTPFQGGPYGICCGQSSTGTVSISGASVLSYK